MNKDGIAKLVILQVCVISAIGAAVAAERFRRRRKQRLPVPMMMCFKLVPKVIISDSGKLEELEKFSNYFARQLGFKDASECPQLGKLAHQYLRQSRGNEDNLFAYLSNQLDHESLYVKLMQELDRCILGYFAFHWNYASFVITQVLTAEAETPKRKLKNMVLEATREQRFERITRDLKVARVFSTLVEEMKAIGLGLLNDKSRANDVMVPAALCDRSPVLLLMGGGMGAGKSTVLKDIMKDAFWTKAGKNAVVVEADAFKERDVVFRALSSKGHHNDMLQTAELVHQNSTNAASSLLVTALNEGRDVIMDGTLSWEPFVEQTIAMARSVHQHRYRMGVGYQISDDGSIIENYWEQVESAENDNEETIQRKPYRIELVGVVCDAYLAVVRGIRRAIFMGRAVRVKSQLKSHKKFAAAFPKYCRLVDGARLYCSNSVGAPKLMGWKEGDRNLLVDPEEIGWLKKLSELNEDAHSVLELYPNSDTKCDSTSCWNEVVMCSSRDTIQPELNAAVRSIESQTTPPTLVLP